MHHLTGSYSSAIGALIKDQFSASKAMADGRAGAEALAAQLDLGRYLCTVHMNLDDLKDPSQLPEAIDVEAGDAPAGVALLPRPPECGSLCKCGGGRLRGSGQERGGSTPTAAN